MELLAEILELWHQEQKVKDYGTTKPLTPETLSVPFFRFPTLGVGDAANLDTKQDFVPTQAPIRLMEHMQEWVGTTWRGKAEPLVQLRLAFDVDNLGIFSGIVVGMVPFQAVKPVSNVDNWAINHEIAQDKI